MVMSVGDGYVAPVACLVTGILVGPQGIGIEDIALDVVCDLLELAIDEVGILDVLEDGPLIVEDEIDVSDMAELLDDSDAQVDARHRGIGIALHFRPDEAFLDDDPLFGKGVFFFLLSLSRADDAVDPHPNGEEMEEEEETEEDDHGERKFRDIDDQEGNDCRIDCCPDKGDEEEAEEGGEEEGLSQGLSAPKDLLLGFENGFDRLLRNVLSVLSDEISVVDSFHVLFPSTLS